MSSMWLSYFTVTDETDCNRPQINTCNIHKYYISISLNIFQFDICLMLYFCLRPPWELAPPAVNTDITVMDRKPHYFVFLYIWFKFVLNVGDFCNTEYLLYSLTDYSNRNKQNTYFLDSQWWLWRRRMWLVKSMRLSLPMPSETSLPMSASAVLNSNRGLRHPHDPCWPANQRGTGLALWSKGWERSRVWVHSDWQQSGCQQVWNICVSEQNATVVCVYFWAYACLWAINNGWAQRWECGGGNRRRHPCQPRKNQALGIHRAAGEDSIS